MEQELAGQFLSNTELGLSAVFLAQFLLMFWTLRNDAKEHKIEIQALANTMLATIEKNTESITRLAQNIENLRHK